MPLISVTSPHATGKADTGAVMRQVLLAALPGLAVLVWAFGGGVLLNVVWCMALALGLEAVSLKIRQRPVVFFLKDGSALVTGFLVGIAIPPGSPWWLSLTGLLFAIPVAKHLYGGLGSNPFNPAMVAYALLLVSFPADMSRWVNPEHTVDAGTVWQGFLGHSQAYDSLTGATPLDLVRTSAREELPATGWFEAPMDLRGWAGVNLAFLLGGLYLLARRLITWHIPVAMLATLSLLSLGFYLADSLHHPSPFFHLLSGATMLGAFFIATDPVTAATSRPGQLVYGAGIGLLIFIIRSWGGYPDAVAFAVLLMNLAAPTIDHWIRPRTFGHEVKPVQWREGRK